MSLAYVINDLFLIKGDFKNSEADLTAGKDLTGYNIKAEAKENLTMHVGNNLTLSTKADTTHKVEDKREEIVGIFTHNDKTPIRHNVGISIGSKTINTMTKLDFKDVNLDINQNFNTSSLMTGYEIWGGLVHQGIVNKGFEKIANRFNDLGIDKIKTEGSWQEILSKENRLNIKTSIQNTINATKDTYKDIVNMTGLKTNDWGSITGSITSHPSSISQSIKVEVGKDKKEPKNIYRGEAQEAITTESIKPIYHFNENFWTKK